MTEASVVICAYTLDRWDDLNAAIASVRNQTRPAREIILVVDNNEALLERARREIEGVVITPDTNVRGANLGPGVFYAESKFSGRPNQARGSLAFQKPRPSHRYSDLLCRLRSCHPSSCQLVVVWK